MRLRIMISAALALVMATAGTVVVAAPAQASGSGAPADFGEPDEALVAELMGQGLGVGERGEQRYSASFFVAFYAGGTGQPPALPTLGIDEPIGGSRIPVMVGDFCK